MNSIGLLLCIKDSVKTNILIFWNHLNGLNPARDPSWVWHVRSRDLRLSDILCQFTLLSVTAPQVAYAFWQSKILVLWTLTRSCTMSVPIIICFVHIHTWCRSQPSNVSWVTSVPSVLCTKKLQYLQTCHSCNVYLVQWWRRLLPPYAVSQDMTHVNMSHMCLGLIKLKLHVAVQMWYHL